MHSLSGGDPDSSRTRGNQQRDFQLVRGGRVESPRPASVSTPDSASKVAQPHDLGSATRALERLGYPVEPLIDYRLQRRAVLRDLRRGSIGIYEACDASPYLLRAANFFGECTRTTCPVCRVEALWQVCFAYGDDMGRSAGQAVGIASLPALARRFGECEIYSVEVCRDCSWNHLVEKFLLVGKIPPGRQSDLVHGA